MRCTDRSEMPAVLAIDRPVQCVSPGGGSPQVSATTHATVSAAIDGLPGLRVLSRSRTSSIFLGKALLPAPHHGAPDIELGRHLLHRSASCRIKNDPGRSIICPAGCDPTRSPQADAAPARSTTRILFVPCQQTRTSHPHCESRECIRAIAFRNHGYRGDTQLVGRLAELLGAMSRCLNGPCTGHAGKRSSCRLSCLSRQREAEALAFERARATAAVHESEAKFRAMPRKCRSRSGQRAQMASTTISMHVGWQSPALRQRKVQPAAGLRWCIRTIVRPPYRSGPVAA